MTNLDSVLKSKDITLPTKVCIVKAIVFPVVVYRYELDHKEGWEPKNWCFWTVVLEKTLEGPLEIKAVNLKGNQPWILIGRTDAEAEAPVFWSPDVNRGLFGKVPVAGKIEGKKKRVSEGEMAGWTWTWANSGRWCGTGRHGVLRLLGLQGVGHDLVTKQQQKTDV